VTREDPWLGDVSAGVDAWTQRASTPTPAAPPPDPVADGPDADHESVARKILLDQLTGQARSRKELSDKLASRNVPDEIATALLDRFEEVGLVDDEAFARDALDDVDPADEEAAARALVRKKLRTLSRVDDTTATRRLVGMLARKGYGSGLAFAVVRDELAAAERSTADLD
jgi:regulatory protein